MDEFKILKEKINSLNKELSSLNDELKEKYVLPYYDDLTKLQEIVPTLPEGITKFMAYVRIEELKHNK